MGGKGGSAQSCAVRTALCSPSQTPPGCEIRTFHRHHHPRDAGHSPPPSNPPPALLTSAASPGGCRTSPRFHPACRRPGPGSPAERGVTTAAPSHPHPIPISIRYPQPYPHLHPHLPSPIPSPFPPHPIAAVPHSRAWRGRDFWSPHRTCGMDGSAAVGHSGDGVRGTAPGVGSQQWGRRRERDGRPKGMGTADGNRK